MDTEKKMSTSMGRLEKKQELMYLLSLSVLISSLVIWMVFRNRDSFTAPAPGFESSYVQQSKEFAERQDEAVPMYDTLFSRIASLQGSPGNPILETDIMTGINSLNAMNENLPTKDARFVGFHQMALFLKLYFEDMMVLKKKMENIRHFQEELNQCEIGYKDGQTLMNQIKAAQAAKTNQ